MSAISALVRIFDVGLFGIWEELVAFYRQALAPLYRAIELLPLPFSVPPTAIDLLTLYLVLLMMSVRAGLIQWFKLRQIFRGLFCNIPDDQKWRHTYIPFLKVALESLMLLPVFTMGPLRSYLATRLMRNVKVPDNDKYAAIINGVGPSANVFLDSTIQIATLPVAIISFFVLNALAPV